MLAMRPSKPAASHQMAEGIDERNELYIVASLSCGAIDIATNSCLSGLMCLKAPSVTDTSYPLSNCIAESRILCSGTSSTSSLTYSHP